MRFPAQDLTSQYISSSYQDVLQQYIAGGLLYVLDGYGNVVFTLNSSSIGDTVISSNMTSSMTVASASVSNIYQVHQVSSSFASSSLSASYAATASYISGSVIGLVLSASYSTTSSYALYTNVANSSISSIFSDTASISIYSEYAGTASMAAESTSASYAPSNDLDSLKDVTITNPIVSDFLGWNGIEWVNAQVGNTSAGSAVNYYLSGDPTFGGNETLSPTPEIGSEAIDTALVSNANSPQFIARYLSPIVVGNIDAGVWTFHTHASVDNASIGTSIIYTRINRATELTGSVSITGTGLFRTASFTGVTPLVQSDTGSTSNILSATLIQTPSQSFWITTVSSSGIALCQATTASYINETNVSSSLYHLLFRIETPKLTTTSPDLYEVTTIQPAFSMSVGDRIVAAYFGSTTSSPSRTISLYHGGTSSYSYIQTPLITRHNDLKGLQGGTSGEYYHLTQAEYIYLQNGTASYALTASYVSGSSNASISASYALTASYALNVSNTGNSVSSSWASSSLLSDNALTSDFAVLAGEAIHTTTSSYALTASFLQTSGSIYTYGATYSGSRSIINGLFLKIKVDSVERYIQLYQ